MQDFYLIINWAVAISLLCLGLAALIKNSRLTLNRVFAFFTLSVSIWIVASYISNDVKNSPHVSVLGNYLVFLFSYISGYLLLWFAIVLAEDHKAAKRFRAFMIPILLAGAINCTSLVVAGAQRQGSVYAVKFGPLVLVYFTTLLASLIGALVILHKNIKRSSGDKKSHLVIVYKSMAIALPIILITEFILPALTGWFGLTNIGILPMAIPVVGLYYSVVKLKLFNLRMAVVRALAYILTITIIGVVYGALSYYLTTITYLPRNRAMQAVLDVLLIMVALNIYPPMLQGFRRLSNKLFYRDAYDPQTLLDEINKVLVADFELESLLRDSAEVISSHLRPAYAVFSIEETQHTAHRVVGTVGHPHLKADALTFARHNKHAFQDSLIVADLLSDSQRKLRESLEGYDIAVIARLALVKGAGDMGYLYIGPKKNGSHYTSQDLKIIQIIGNELAIAVQNALRFEEIQNFNITLQDKVNDATRQLRRTNEKLKQLDETKDDFISMASHQLRTPLTSVKGYLSMVLEGDAGKITPMQKEMLGQAFFSSQRMVYIIADLLNVSRLKTGKFIIDPVKVNLADVIQEELEQVEEMAGAKQLTLQYDKPKEFPDLMLDDTKTRQVIMNFVDNAIYYTPAGGHITVRLINKPGSIELRVEDNGMGVPKHEQPHLFTKFYRAGNARKARPDGTGLGLFMAKKVVLAQGGSILFESQESKGSTFGFILSKAHLAPAAPAAKPAPVKAAP